MRIVIDTSVVMNTNSTIEDQGEIYVPNLVLKEIKSRLAGHLFEILRSKYRVTILDPDQKSLDKIRITSRKIGQTGLSLTDEHVLALAYSLSKDGKVLLLSDDYAVRNVAHALGLVSKGTTTKGGNEFRRYKFKCTGCGSVYFQNIIECEICGHAKFKRMRR